MSLLVPYMVRQVLVMEEIPEAINNREFEMYFRVL